MVREGGGLRFRTLCVLAILAFSPGVYSAPNPVHTAPHLQTTEERISFLIFLEQVLPGLFREQAAFDTNLLDVLKAQEDLVQVLEKNPEYQRLLSDRPSKLLSAEINADNIGTVDVEAPTDPARIEQWKNDLIARMGAMPIRKGGQYSDPYIGQIAIALQQVLARKPASFLSALIRFVPEADRSRVSKMSFDELLPALAQLLPEELVSAGFQPERYDIHEAKLTREHALKLLSESLENDRTLGELIQIRFLLQDYTGLVERDPDRRKEIIEGVNPTSLELFKDRPVLKERTGALMQDLADDPALAQLRSQGEKKAHDLVFSAVSESVKRVVQRVKGPREITRMSLNGKISLVEVPPFIGIFRGCVMANCSTSHSFAYPNSPQERTFIVKGPNGVKGGVAATIVNVAGEKTLYVHTIDGIGLSPVDIELILTSLYAIREELGVRKIITLEASNITNHVNREQLQAAFRSAIAGKPVVEIEYLDPGVRKKIGDLPEVTSAYDSEVSNARGVRFTPRFEKSPEVAVRWEDPPRFAPVPPTKQQFLLFALDLRHSSRTWLIAEVLGLGNIGMEIFGKISQTLENEDRLSVQGVQDRLKSLFERAGGEFSEALMKERPFDLWPSRIRASDAFEPKYESETVKAAVSLLKSGKARPSEIDELVKKHPQAFSRSTSFRMYINSQMDLETGDIGTVARFLRLGVSPNVLDVENVRELAAKAPQSVEEGRFPNIVNVLRQTVSVYPEIGAPFQSLVNRLIRHDERSLDVLATCLRSGLSVDVLDPEVIKTFLKDPLTKEESRIWMDILGHGPTETRLLRVHPDLAGPMAKSNAVLETMNRAENGNGILEALGNYYSRRGGKYVSFRFSSLRWPDGMGYGRKTIPDFLGPDGFDDLTAAAEKNPGVAYQLKTVMSDWKRILDRVTEELCSAVKKNKKLDPDIVREIFDYARQSIRGSSFLSVSGFSERDLTENFRSFLNALETGLMKEQLEVRTEAAANLIRFLSQLPEPYLSENTGSVTKVIKRLEKDRILAEKSGIVGEYVGDRLSVKERAALDEIVSNRRSNRRKPPTRKPDGLPRPELRSGGRSIPATAAPEPTMEGRIAQWKVEAGNVPIEIILQPFDSNVIPIGEIDWGRTQIVDGKVVVTLYRQANGRVSDVAFEHEKAISLEFASRYRDVFERITKTDIESSSEIEAKLGEVLTPRELVQLALLNIAEIAGIDGALGHAKMSKPEQAALLVERIRRRQLMDRIQEKLGWSQKSINLDGWIAALDQVPGKWMTRTISVRERLNNALAEKKLMRAAGRAAGLEMLRGVAGLPNFVPAVIASYVVIEMIETNFSKPSGVVFQEAMAMLATPQFWLQYGQFHVMDLAVTAKKIDVTLATRMAHRFKPRANAFEIFNTTELIKPSINTALVFVAMNLLNNSVAGVDMILHDTAKTPSQKAFKLAEILTARGWIKTGVDVTVFSGMMTAGAGLGLAGGAMLGTEIVEGLSGPFGVALLGASLVLTHFADKLYDRVENVYHQVREQNFEAAVIERLQSSQPVNEFNDQLSKLLTSPEAPGIMNLPNLHRTVQYLWGATTGESPAFQNRNGTGSILWHFDQMSRMNDLQRQWMLSNVEKKIKDLEVWAASAKAATHNRLTGSMGYLILAYQAEFPGEALTDATYYGLGKWSRTARGEGPRPKPGIHKIGMNDDLPDPVELEVNVAKREFQTIDIDLKRELRLPSTEPPGSFLEKINAYERQQLGLLTREHQERWQAHVQGEIQTWYPRLESHVAQERETIKFMEGIGRRRPDFIKKAVDRMQSLTESWLSLRNFRQTFR